MNESVDSFNLWLSKLFTFSNEVTWDTLIQAGFLFSGFLFILWQLRANRQLQLKQHRDTIRYNAYEKLVYNFENSQPTGMSMTLNILMIELEKAIDRKKKVGKYFAPPFYVNDINDQFIELHSNLIQITATMDKYQIVTGHMSLFSKVLSRKISELTNQFKTLISVFSYILLHEKGMKTTLHVPNIKAINKIKEKVSEFNDTAWEINYYLDDILTETQNCMLGDFFKHPLPVRKPSDPNVLVLTSTDQEMIKKAQELVGN